VGALLLPRGGEDSVVGEGPGWAEEAQRTHVFEPEAERRPTRVRPAAQDPAEAGKEALGELGDRFFAEQCVAAALGFSAAQRALVRLRDQPAVQRGPSWRRAVASAVSAIPTMTAVNSTATRPAPRSRRAAWRAE
jgi:hypothetical protein